MFIMSRFAKSFLVVVTVLGFFSILAFLHPPTRAYIDPWTGQLFGEGGVEAFLRNSSAHPLHDSFDFHKHNLITGVHGDVIMSKMENATAKAALGRATWKLIHTMTLRFPEHPSPDERNALSSYFHLLSRLYPCGECAAEFQALLRLYPPQTSSRRVASLWLCSVHNEVNRRLRKEQFDCANLDAEYDCGCGDNPGKGDKGATKEAEDLMDLEHDPSVDIDTGIGMIKGG